MSVRASECCNFSPLREASRAVTRVYDGELAPVGVSMHQYTILLSVSRRGPISLGHLAQAMRIDRSTLGHLVKPLVARGLLTVGSQPGDGRRRVLALSDAGDDVVRRARPLWQQAQRRFETSFGPDRAHALRDALATLNATDFGSRLCENALIW